jgi:lambda family phage tail tape measure protein
MATEVLELVISARGASQASSEFDKMQRSVSGVRSALAFLRNALVVFSAIRAFSGLSSLVDTFVIMQNKLALVTRDQNEANTAIEALSQIAQRSRSPLDATVTLFTRMSRALSSMKLSYGELFDIVEATNKAMIISGATSDEAARAVVQFTQGLALGVLRGQDLRSVVEFAPRLAQVFADQLSKSAPIVKQYGENFRLSAGALYGFVTAHRNVLSSEVIVKAYKDALAEMNGEFDKTTPTIGNAFTNLKSAVEIFIGRASQANGLLKGTIQAIDFVRVHLAAFAEALIVIAGLFVFNFLAKQVITFGQIAFSVVSAVVSAFVTLGATLVRVGIIGTSMIRTFIGLTAIGAVVAILIALFETFGGTMDDLIGGVEKFVAGFITGLQYIGHIGKQIFDALGDSVVSTINFILRQFQNVKNFATGGNAPASQLKNPFEGGVAALLKPDDFDLSATFDKNLASVQAFRKGLEDALHGGVSNDDIAALRKLQAALSGTTDTLDNVDKSKLSQYTDQIEAFLARVSPFFDVTSKIDKIKDLFSKAEAAGVNVDAILAKDTAANLTRADVFNRIAREEIGAGNAAAYYAERIALLDDFQRKNVITEEERVRLARKASIEYLSAQFDIVSGVKLAAATIADELGNEAKITAQVVEEAQKDLTAKKILEVQTLGLAEARRQNALSTEQEERALRQLNIAALEAQFDAGSGSRRAFLKQNDELANEAKINEDIVNEATKASYALRLLDVQTKLLDGDLKDGTLTAEEYVRRLRDLRIEALSSQDDAVSGINRGLLEMQKSFADVAASTADLVKNTFGSLESTITSFVKTGKLSFSDLANTILDGLIKIAVQQAIMKPLADWMGGGPTASGGGGAGGILGSILGSFGTGGSTGGAGILSTAASFLGFADGGSFMVGGGGGTDSQLVAFRASPNERVTVEKPNQQAQSDSRNGGMMLGNLTLHIHGVQDYDGFQRSEDQIYAGAARRLNRATYRNN